MSYYELFPLCIVCRLILHLYSIHLLHQQTLSSMVSCQKGPTRHAYAWQIGPFWQDTLE